MRLLGIMAKRVSKFSKLLEINGQCTRKAILLGLNSLLRLWDFAMPFVRLPLVKASKILETKINSLARA